MNESDIPESLRAVQDDGHVRLSADRVRDLIVYLEYRVSCRRTPTMHEPETSVVVLRRTRAVIAALLGQKALDGSLVHDGDCTTPANERRCHKWCTSRLPVPAQYWAPGIGPRVEEQ